MDSLYFRAEARKHWPARRAFLPPRVTSQHYGDLMTKYSRLRRRGAEPLMLAEVEKFDAPGMMIHARHTDARAFSTRCHFSERFSSLHEAPYGSDGISSYFRQLLWASTLFGRRPRPKADGGRAHASCAPGRRRYRGTQMTLDHRRARCRRRCRYSGRQSNVSGHADGDICHRRFPFSFPAPLYGA